MMANEIYIIRTSTLRAIADSIRAVRGLTMDIPTSELASALRTGTVTSTAEPTTFSVLRIRRQTLVDIADVIREHTGDTSEIPVRELSAKILSTFAAPAKLDTPSIYVETEDDEPAKLETPVIYKATVDDSEATTLIITDGEATYEENSGGGLTLIVMTDSAPKLATPNIRLMTDAVPKLTTPSIYLTT